MYTYIGEELISVRTLCEVLEEMRKCVKTLNFSYLLGLIEEAQVLGNRMESGLGDKHSIEAYHQDARKARHEFEDLEARKSELEDEIRLLEKKAEALGGKPKAKLPKIEY